MTVPTSTPAPTRVAVTGVGLRTPVGATAGDVWSALLEGRAAATVVDELAEAGVPVTHGCPVPGFDGADVVGPREARRLDRATLLGLAAGGDAVAAAAVEADPARCAVVAGTGVGGIATLDAQERVFFEKGPRGVSPMLVPMMMANATAAHLSMALGWTGPSLCIATACAAGANAIGEGARLVRTGAADVVLAGGTESAITPLTVSAFWRMGALSSAGISRPFDAQRDGFVMGEGAGFVVLERWVDAVARGATILGEVGGYAANCDAHHVTAPAPGGEGAAACMAAALEDAGLVPGDVVHVNAHGTSTPLNDAAEAEAIGKVLGEGAVVTSVKGATGHLVGAAGAVEAVVALRSAALGVVPPVANHTQPDPTLGVDVVAGAPRVVAPGPVLSNSFGFGGHNASLVLLPA